ncbi:MAG: magnesium and cobalt transport protein CorA [Candidatus Nanopelagicales bacterium]
MIVGCGRYLMGQEVDREISARLVAGGDLAAPAVRDIAAMLAAGRGEIADFVWVAVAAPHPQELVNLGEALEIPDLWIQDALNPRQRTKYEMGRNGKSALILFKMIEYVEATSDVETGQLAVFVGASYVLTVRWGALGRLAEVRQNLAADPTRLAIGPLAVVHGIADAIVDDYLTVSDALDRDVDELEEVVFSAVISDDSGQIYRLKRENLEMRRAIAPLVPLAQLLLRPGRWIPDPLSAPFHDVSDHLQRVHDMVESRDSLLLTMLEASNARQSLQQNVDMRKIAAYAAILAFPTAIAGIYGMNFDFMPELQYELGYPAALSVMLVGCLVLFGLFKRSGWL